MEWLESLGLLGLFIGTFLAATIFPFSSDVLYMAILAATANPIGCLLVGTLGNWPEAEGKDRQVRSVACPDGLDPVHRRRHSHSPGLLQDPSGLDNAPAAGRQICEVPGLEPHLRTFLDFAFAQKQN